MTHHAATERWQRFMYHKFWGWFAIALMIYGVILVIIK